MKYDLFLGDLESWYIHGLELDIDITEIGRRRDCILSTINCILQICHTSQVLSLFGAIVDDAVNRRNRFLASSQIRQSMLNHHRDRHHSRPLQAINCIKPHLEYTIRFNRMLQPWSCSLPSSSSYYLPECHPTRGLDPPEEAERPRRYCHALRPT